MMLQDIFPHKLNNQYDPSAGPNPEDAVLVLQGRSVLARLEDAAGLTFPRVSVLPSPEQKKLRYLFSVDGEQYFLYPAGPDFNPDSLFPGFAFLELNGLREQETPPKHRMFAAYTGKHLADWYRDTCFCGRCGSPMKHSETERAMVCTACGYTAYPRIMPAVIVGVTNGDRILLTRYRTGYSHNALIAGFTEIGETVEETVSREVMEEAGVQVKNIRYYKSQPWGAANDILMGFYCDVDGDDTIRMDGNELKYASWVKREEIELQPDESSLTNEMMKMFKEGKQ